MPDRDAAGEAWSLQGPHQPTYAVPPEATAVAVWRSGPFAHLTALRRFVTDIRTLL